MPNPNDCTCYTCAGKYGTKLSLGCTRSEAYTVSVQGDPRWAAGVSETMACKLARVAVRMNKQGVAVTRDRDGARMSLRPDGSGKGYKLLTPAEAARE